MIPGRLRALLAASLLVSPVVLAGAEIRIVDSNGAGEGLNDSSPAEPVVDRIDIGVAQGFVEESNVNPVLEMTRLIMVQRSFENAMALTRDTETSLDDALKTLGG